MESSSDRPVAAATGAGASFATAGIASDATFPAALDGTYRGESATDSYLRQQNAQMHHQGDNPLSNDDVPPNASSEPTAAYPDYEEENLRAKRARTMEGLNNNDMDDHYGGRGKAMSSAEDARLQNEYRQMLNDEAKGSPLRDKERTQGKFEGSNGDELAKTAPAAARLGGTYDTAAIASGEAVVVIDNGGDPSAPRTTGDSLPRRIQLDYADAHKMSQYIFDAPTPEFYLGAALVIGCVCLFTWMAAFILDYGDIGSKYLWIITCCGSFLFFFIGPFIYYQVTSGHYFFFGRVWDAFCGAVPCFVAAFGIIFVYAFGIETIINTDDHGTMEGKFLIFGTLPVYLVVVLPVFICMLKFQDKVADRYRASRGYPPVDYEKTRALTSGWRYMGIMLRRVIVGWICGVAVAAHISLPAYGLSWAAYGLYKLEQDKGVWTIFVILIPPIVLLIALAIIPYTRPIPMFLVFLLDVYFICPLQGWDPREGHLWNRYDNSLTYERLTDQHNTYIGKAEKFYSTKEDIRANEYYRRAAQTKLRLIEGRVPIAELDLATGKRVSPPVMAPTVVDEAALKGAENPNASTHFEYGYHNGDQAKQGPSEDNSTRPY